MNNGLYKLGENEQQTLKARINNGLNNIGETENQTTNIGQDEQQVTLITWR